MDSVVYFYVHIPANISAMIPQTLKSKISAQLDPLPIATYFLNLYYFGECLLLPVTFTLSHYAHLL